MITVKKTPTSKISIKNIFIKRNATRGFGAVPSYFDERDYNYRDNIACSRESFPDKYVTYYPSMVYDQEDSNMCVACSLALIRFIQTYKQNGRVLNFDPLFIYANRDMLKDEVMYKGEGMAVRDALKILHNFGDSLWNDEYSGYYTYNTAVKIFNDHKDDMVTQASPYKIDSYYAVKSISDIKSAIISFGAVSAMFPVYNCLNKLEATKEGHSKVKFSLVDRAKKPNGYHQMTIIGWNDECWIVQNSWGKEYGDDGIVYIPMGYPIMEAWTTLDFYDELKQDSFIKRK